MLGVMIDCSRNAVMTVAAVKEYVNLLEKMGYDTLMLYTEDTYVVDDEPYFGYMRGRYTKEELKEIDIYCRGKGVDLIPCIQTLAHLNGIFQVSDTYASIRDCDDILLIEDERTYQLIDHMFVSLAECFTSRKVHIGMDEADKVGLGVYLKKHGYEERFDLINRHLHKVCDIAGQYGFAPMIWSDMFCRLAAGTSGYYDGADLDKIRAKADLPKQISMVYWDYYSTDYEHYVKMIRTNHAFARPVIFAGGAWTWKGFMPDNALSFKTMEPALKACIEEGVEDVIMTMWGDDGAECSRLSVLPMLLYAAETMRGNTDMGFIKQKFAELTGMDWEDFMLLDQLDAEHGTHGNNPSKYLLYNDPFMGLSDYRVMPGDGEYYRGLRERLEQVKTAPQFCHMFDMAIALCKALEIKTELGIDTRKFYLAGDREGLRKIATEKYMDAEHKIEEFYNAFAIQWFMENKPFGFDIQDIRIGGLIWRLKQCRQRLLDYTDGKIDRIPELEETILENTNKPFWGTCATPNVVSHMYFG